MYQLKHHHQFVASSHSTQLHKKVETEMIRLFIFSLEIYNFILAEVLESVSFYMWCQSYCS